MKAILVEICWSDIREKNKFREMTEIAAVQLNLIDGMIVTGGTFHSFIRPVYQHWKKQKSVHLNYSDWWLAKPFPKVIENFLRWYGHIGDVPWIISDQEILRVLYENSKKHAVSLIWPKNVVLLNQEFEKVDLPLPIGHSVIENRNVNIVEKSPALAAERVNQYSQILAKNFSFEKMTLIPFEEVLAVSPGKIQQQKREKVVEELLMIYNKGHLSIEELAEWSRLTTVEVREILLSEAPLTPFERERMNQAWKTWGKMKELSDQWIDS